MNSTRHVDLTRLLRPRSIAVIGGAAGATVINKCRAIGYGGTIVAVHPTRPDLAGVPCVRSIEALRTPPDAVFLGVSGAQSIEAVGQLAHLGAGGAVCYASGFAEAGGDGEAAQQQLVQQAGAMPIVGPNCHGFLNFLDGVALWPDHFGGEQTASGPALLVQSGNIGINVTFQQRGLTFSYVVAMGNNAQLGVHDYIHALLDDDRVTAIGLHLEGISDLEQFTQAALRALAQGIPLVALKTGSSSLGAQMALSHTRSLARPDALIDTLFQRYGIARCQTLSEFLETLKFVSFGVLKSERTSVNDTRPRLASMSCSGGEASHLADLAEPLDVRFPSLTNDTRDALQMVLGDRVHISNPLDYHTYSWGDYDTLSSAFSTLLRDPLECALLILDYPPPDSCEIESWKVAERALCAASDATDTRVVVVASLPENFPASARARLMELGVAPMQGLRECLTAIAHAAAVGRAQQNHASLAPLAQPHVLVPGATLDEYESKQLLAAYGVPIPESREGSVRDAAEMARAVGFPVVIKALGESLAHKTELNAVRLNVSSSEAARTQAAELSVISNRVLIESMVTDAVAELLVGVSADEAFGQVLVIGAGGVLVELLNDSVQLLLPVTKAQITEALHQLACYPLLTGYRGRPVGDIDAAVEAIAAIARFAVDHCDRLVELDVNPLMVRPRQDSASSAGGAVAVDALVRWGATHRN
ncbi:MAG: acetate--CoA ligase family protein [Pseudomonadota bacterium]